MHIDFKEKIIAEKILLISIIGVLEAMEKKVLLIDEAEKYLFSPHTINVLKKENYNINIIDILERGCELEDVRSLLPDRLTENILELKQKALKVITEYPKIDNRFWVE